MSKPASGGRDWAAHLQATKSAPPSPLLVAALPFVAERGHALDLGAGGLKDTRHLLAQGFGMVTVLDGEPTVRELGADLPADRVRFVVSRYDAFGFPSEAHDLVNAQYSLPFNPPETFDGVMERMRGSLKHGGIFCGQLFGIQDEWNVPGSKLTFHDTARAKAFFDGMEILRFDERIRDGKLASGAPKHWHVFDVIARRA